MTNLISDFAIGHLAPMTRTIGAFHMEEKPNFAIASLALRKDGQSPEPFGMILPAAGYYQTSGHHMALWSGLDQWLILSETVNSGEYISQLRPVCLSCSVTEQTDGWVIIDINYDSNDQDFSEFIALLVNIDPDKLQVGQCTRTLIHHLSCHIIKTGECALRILGARSAAFSLWHTLETIAENLLSRHSN